MSQSIDQIVSQLREKPLSIVVPNEEKEPSKVCMKCREKKTLTCYSKLARSSDGHQPQCKSCCAEYMKEYSRRRTEKTRELKELRLTTEERMKNIEIQLGVVMDRMSLIEKWVLFFYEQNSVKIN